MEKETKICPYCGEEILAIAKKCKYCKEWLDKERKDNNIINNIKYKKKLLIIFAVILICLFDVLIFFLWKDLNSNKNNEFINLDSYKSISPNMSKYCKVDLDSCSYYIADNNNVDEIVTMLIEQENDLMDFFKQNHSKEENSLLFRTYYKNLKIISEAIDYPLANEIPVRDESFNPSDLTIGNSVKLKAEFDKNNIDYFSIDNPKTDVIKLVNVGEGLTGANINYIYLFNAFSEYLTEDMSDFLKNKKKVNSDLGFINYFDDGYTIPDPLTVAKWAVMWEKFLKKYDNFILKEEVEEDIRKYSEDVLFRNENGSLCSDNENLCLDEKGIKGCIYFLKHANKDNPSYKNIETSFNILKKNGYVFTDEYTESLPWMREGLEEDTDYNSSSFSSLLPATFASKPTPSNFNISIPKSNIPQIAQPTVAGKGGNVGNTGPGNPNNIN